MDAFVDWMRGSQAAEMRRIAGFATPGVNGSMNGESASGSAPVTGATTMPAVAVGGTTLESGPKNDEWLAGMFGISVPSLHLTLSAARAFPWGSCLANRLLFKQPLKRCLISGRRRIFNKLTNLMIYRKTQPSGSLNNPTPIARSLLHLIHSRRIHRSIQSRPKMAISSPGSQLGPCHTL